MRRRDLCIVAGAVSGGTRRESIPPERVGEMVHAEYFGRVYYWVQGLEAVPYHLGECIECRVLWLQKTVQTIQDSNEGKNC
jgi:hypothetical protein